MTKKKLFDRFKLGHGFTKEDWDAVSDNPEWTKGLLTNYRSAEHTMGCGARANDFHPDDALLADHRATPADYVRSGYDRYTLRIGRHGCYAAVFGRAIKVCA